MDTWRMPTKLRRLWAMQAPLRRPLQGLWRRTVYLYLAETHMPSTEMASRGECSQPEERTVCTQYQGFGEDPEEFRTHYTKKCLLWHIDYFELKEIELAKLAKAGNALYLPPVGWNKSLCVALCSEWKQSFKEGKWAPKTEEIKTTHTAQEVNKTKQKSLTGSFWKAETLQEDLQGPSPSAA